MNRKRIKVAFIIMLVSSLGVASAIRKGITWNHPLTYGTYQKCGPVKEHRYLDRQEGKGSSKKIVRDLYLAMNYSDGEEEVLVTESTYNSTKDGQEVCFTRNLEISIMEAFCILAFVVCFVIAIVNAIFEALDFHDW